MSTHQELTSNHRAILYVRSVYDYCLDLQTDVRYRYAEEHGLVAVDLVEDRWGGGMAPRILKELLRRKKKADDFDLLLVTEVTRITDHGTRHAMEVCRQIRDAGIMVRFARKGVAHGAFLPGRS